MIILGLIGVILNATATLRWNCIIAPTLFSNTSLIYSDYNYNIGLNMGGTKFNINSEIKDWNLKEEFQYYPNSKNSIKFGFNSIYHTITPNNYKAVSKDAEKKISRYSLENALFANNTMKISEYLTLDYGLRLSIYSILGGDTYNI
ncbi:hypothetical protein MASR2M117_09620 [Paludibacter sp.]